MIIEKLSEMQKEMMIKTACKVANKLANYRVGVVEEIDAIAHEITKETLVEVGVAGIPDRPIIGDCIVSSQWDEHSFSLM
jgi:hypothetical protein